MGPWRSSLLFNSNTELKQNAAWKQGAFPCLVFLLKKPEIKFNSFKYSFDND